jgi:hypothetical protein
MSDYFEYHSHSPSEHLEPVPSAFIRPLNLTDPTRRRSATTSRHSRTSHGSNLTYVTNPPSIRGENQVPAAEPIYGMPTPVIPGQPMQLTEDDILRGSDFLIVDADPDYDETQDNVDFQTQAGKRGFVGGFVSGLKRLPRVKLKNPRVVDGIDRKERARRRALLEGTSAESDPPSYQPYPDQPPLIPSVEVIEAMEMPTQHTISVTSPSVRDSGDPEQALAEYSDQPHSRPNIHDGETTLIHQSDINIRSPVEVEPLPTSDYDKMSSVLHATPSVSIASHINRLQKFVRDLNELPWVSSRVAVDYFPEQNGRRGHGKTKTPKVTDTWYPVHDNDLDLLSNGTPSVTHSEPATTHRREGEHRRVLTDSTVSPSSAPMSSVAGSPSTMSPGYSVTSEPGPGGRNLRHVRNSRHHSRRHHHHHENRSQPTLYPYIAAPQPLYVIPGPPSPVVQQLGSAAGSPRQNGSATTSSGMPVYMIPLPPPVYQPMPGYAYTVTQQQASNAPTRL